MWLLIVVCIVVCIVAKFEYPAEFCMLCVCFVFVFVEQIGPGSRFFTKRNVCVSFVFVFVTRLGRPKRKYVRTRFLGVKSLLLGFLTTYSESYVYI